MALKTFKPYTKSVRGTILVDRKNLWKGKPFKPLTSVKNSSSGRNNLGRITARNVGGGHKQKYRNIDLIYSANTLSHIANLDSVFKSINYLLSDDGILIIEDPSLLECLKRVAYDQFYNEHIYVFSTIALQNILKKTI